MKIKKTNGFGTDLLWLILGSAAYMLVGWRWSAPAAAWIAPIFLLRFFRNQEKWYAPLLAVPFLYGAFLANMIGAWDLPLPAQLFLPLVVPLPLILVLYIDRVLYPRLRGPAATLVFPTAYVTVDYLLGFTPLGTLFSLASTQFGFTTVAQTASITGIWGVSFLITWFASIMNTTWENGFDLRSRGGGVPRRTTPVTLFLTVALLSFAYGSVRIAASAGDDETVRVAGITVEHPRDYWSLLEAGTPASEVEKLGPEIRGIEEELFRLSDGAVQTGARIVFWSEGNGVIPENEMDRFIARCRDFAKNNGIYFAPAILELRFGGTLNHNEVLMFTPQGRQAFTYQKTKSWLPVESDGVIKTVATPYGTVAAAICFDMDFPNFVRQAAGAGTDIMLVPGYDSERIRPFHTEPALLRGIEGGYSVIRQVSHGTSMAADWTGTVLARQDYFTTRERVMLSDIPVRGRRTVYGVLGDWFAWISAGGLLLAAAAAIRNGTMRKNETAA